MTRMDAAPPLHTATQGRVGWITLHRPQRLNALNDALMDALGAALLARYESVLRPEALRWAGWVEGQLGKVRDGLALVEKNAASLNGRLDIGTITIGCALGYLDFRFPDLDWRAGHPATAAWYETFSQRPSMQATKP